MNKLIHGDCIKALKNMASETADMIFADPPFNINKKYAGTFNDNIEPSEYYFWCETWINECFRILKSTGTFYLMTQDHHLENLFPIMKNYGKYINLIKWKNATADRCDRRYWNMTQPILMYGKTEDYKFNRYAQTRNQKQIIPSWSKKRKLKKQMGDLWEDIPLVYTGSITHPEAILKPGTQKKAHPTQMPVNLADRCILFSTDENDLVIDPFNGSGTTGISCLKLKREFIGIEIAAEYIELARNRWEAYEKQLTLF